MVDTSSLPLGSVAVEVKADLTKLVADFARGRQVSQAFAQDLQRATSATGQNAAATAALSQQYQGLVRQYDPLRVARQKYIQDVATIQQAEKAGFASSAESVALQASMAAAFQDTTKRIEGQTVGLEGWARKTEHHLRAIRLIYSFVIGETVLRLGELAVKTLEATAAIKNQADSIGISAQKLQEYRAIAPQVGMAAGDMDKAFQHLKGVIDDIALGKADLASKMFKRLGVDIHDAAGKVKPLDVIFNELIDKLGQVGNEAQRQGGQVIAFGEAGDKMGQLIQQGSGGISKLQGEVRKLGLVLSDEQIQKADETSKKLNLLWQVLKIQFADVVVRNADAIDTIATSLGKLAEVSLSNIVQSIGDLVARIEQLLGAARDLRDFAPSLRQTGPDYTISGLSDAIGTYNYGSKPSTGLIGKALSAIGMNAEPPPGPVSVTSKLPAATKATADQERRFGKGSNIDLSGLESPKDKKDKQAKFDQFAQDMAQELQRQLEIEKGATTDLVKQTQIEKEIIAEKLIERDKQIDRQVKSHELTAKEGEKLKAEAKITADMEREEADRKLQIALIERQYAYSAETAQLDTDALNIAHDMARTDKERRDIDFKLLDIKQEQARLELEKQIRILEENKKDRQDQERIDQLKGEYIKLLANQAAEVKDFKIQHLTGIEKFRNDLPRTVQDINEQLDKIRFDQFTERLQRAADTAKQIGDAFGTFVGDLAQFKNPLDALRSLLTNLSNTLTQNLIVKPVSDWATQRIGVPFAKQAFGKAMTSGPDALTAKQFDVALAQATGTLGGLQKALPGASTSIDAVTTAANPASTSITALGTAADAAASALTNMAATAGAGAAGGGAGGLDTLSALFGGSSAGGGAAAASAGDLTSGLADLSVASTLGLGYAAGGFTGPGGKDQVQGVVHSNEFVLNADAVSQYGLPLLAAMNAGAASVVRSGGAGGPAPAAGGAVVGSATGAAPDLASAAALLMQAAQALMQATKGMGSGMGGGLLGGLLGIVGGSLLGGKGGGLGGLVKLAGGLFGGGGGGGGAAGLASLAGGTGMDLADASVASTLGIGFSSGGFTGSGGDQEIAGPVHRNEWVWDAPTTRRFWPVLELLGAGRIPSFQGPGLGQMMGRGEPVSRPLHIHFGDLHLHGVTDDRSARRSGRQALGVIHRGIAEVARKGLSK